MDEGHMQRLGLVELPDYEEEDYRVTNDAGLSGSSKKGARRKNSKTNKSDDESKKIGKRGRPRVDPQDESAIERRRTQIRLAQRAYRERKETTIAELEKRVAHLQGTIAGITQVFLEFNERTTALGIPPSLAQDMQATSQRISELAGAANFELDAEEGSPKRKRPRQRSPTAAGSAPSDQQQLHRTTSRPSVTSSDGSTGEPDQYILGYPVVNYGSSPEHTPPYDALSHKMDVQSQQQHGWNDASMDVQMYRAGLPQAPAFTNQWKEWVDKPIKSIYTYNFQESSFARRLMRYSYEKTYHLIANPSSNPNKQVEHILRYSLCFRTPQQIAEMIRRKLMQPKGTLLENWDSPNLHIGGAGLHYPREVEAGTVKPVQGFTAQRNVGPWPIHRGSRKVPTQEFPFNLAKFAKVEGVWFDSHDVEQYLRTKGLFLDGHSPIAIMEVEDSTPSTGNDNPPDSPHSSPTENLSVPQSPTPLNEQAASDFFAVDVDNIYAELDPWQERASGDTDLDFSMSLDEQSTKDSSGVMPYTEFVPQLLPALSSVQPEPAKRKLVVDVERLLEALDKNAVCLGRAPGYRLEDVENAIQTVLQESW